MNPSPHPPKKPILLVVSGPAGSGKTTLCNRMLEEFGGSMGSLARVVTSTTRRPRSGEIDRRDYYFLSPDDFQRKVEADEFYEHAKVYENHYGTLKSEIRSKLESTRDLLLNIDVQGAAAFRDAARKDDLLRERLVAVFILPPSLETLRQRLAKRGQNESRDLELRLQVAQREIQEWVYYDYFIPSSSREADYDALRSIYRAELLRNPVREK